MKKESNFFKKYGFYLGISVICIIALAVIIINPVKEKNINDNTYAKNKMAQGEDLQGLNEDDEFEADEKPDMQNWDVSTDGEQETTNIEPKEDQLQQEAENLQAADNAANSNSASTKTDNTKTDNKDEKTSRTDTDSKNSTNNTNSTSTGSKAGTISDSKQDQAVKTETFESTTASVTDEPFFAEGDTFEWPVDGKVVVPYTDESTNSWYSESLNQTMRTFGICIGGSDAQEVKAVAKGTVVKVVDDSSSYLEAGMPYVGKLMVVDLGNGYTTVYGFQGGSVNEKLVGQVVNPGDVLGTIGSPKGAFISQGDNIYLQVKHNDQVVNPLNFLQTSDGAAKDSGVDLGFSK